MGLVRSKRIRTRIEKGRAIYRSNREQRPNKSLARRNLSKRRRRNDSMGVDDIVCRSVVYCCGDIVVMKFCWSVGYKLGLIIDC